MNVAIKISLVLIILAIDLSFYFLLRNRIVYFADHSGIYTVIIMQSFVILEILINCKVTLFVLDSLGLAKKYTHYVFVIMIFLFSLIELHSAIIGTSEWGQPCGGIIECKPSDFK